MTTEYPIPQWALEAFNDWARQKIRTAHRVAAAEGITPELALMRHAWKHLDGLHLLEGMTPKGALRMLHYMLTSEPELAAEAMVVDQSNDPEVHLTEIVAAHTWKKTDATKNPEALSEEFERELNPEKET